MELALNLAWLVLAAALLVMCGVTTPAYPSRWRRILSIVAMLCIVSFLFPVVSITDDLHSGPALLKSEHPRKWGAASLSVSPTWNPVVASPSNPPAEWRRLHLKITFPAQSYGSAGCNVGRRPPPVHEPMAAFV